jgi:hypothetical protein
MGLESGTYIDDLNQNNPTSSDGVSQGDDHLRLIKKVILNTFPNIDNEVTATEDEINKLDGLTATKAELNNADESATSGGGFLKGPTSSSDPSLAFDTWRTPNANRPTFLQVEAFVETDGSSIGVVSIQVDESGQMTPDYDMKIGRADPSAGSGFRLLQTTSVFIPAGASYQIANLADPNSGNSIADIREFTL